MPLLLAAHHRMDGAALSLASDSLVHRGAGAAEGMVLGGGRHSDRRGGGVSPSLGCSRLRLLVWLLAVKPLRRFAIPYLCGVCAGSAAIAAALAATGSLLPASPDDLAPAYIDPVAAKAAGNRRRARAHTAK